VSRGAGTGSNGWQGAVDGGALRGSQSCNTAEAPDPAVCVFGSPADMRLIGRPTHGHACGVELLQCVGVVAVGCVFEARRPWLRISHRSFASNVPIDETNVLSWARAP